MTDQIRTLLARVKELDEKATGGTWEAYSMPGFREQSPYVAVAADDREYKLINLDGAFYDGLLIAEYRSAAPALARALEAVLEVCAVWDHSTDTFDDEDRCTCHRCDIERAITRALEVEG